MHFMHFHYSRTRNCDHHILLIKTSNAHKKRIMPQIINAGEIGEGVETQSELIVAAKWWLLS